MTIINRLHTREVSKRDQRLDLLLSRTRLVTGDHSCVVPESYSLILLGSAYKSQSIQQWS